MKLPNCLKVTSCLLVLALHPAIAQETFQKVAPNARATQREYAEQQQKRLLAGKYDELEKEIATPSLAEPVAVGLGPEGGFFTSFRLDDWQQKPDWAPTFKALDAWEAAAPTSPASRLAHSSALIAYAWAARGSGTADTVTDGGWKLFGERLIESHNKLKEAEKMGGAAQPIYWRNLLILCRGLQAPKQKTTEFTDEALKQFSDNPGIYAGYCIAILPRWGGEPGEWQSWIKAQNADARWAGKEMPADVYARILWQVYDYIRNTDGPLFESKDLSWEKTRQGLDQLCEKYPKSAYWKTARARFAWVANDPKALKEAITALGGSYDSWAMGPKDFTEMLESVRTK